MKIAFLSSFDISAWGGSEMLWSETARYLRRKGHEVLASVHDWPEPPKAILRLRQEGITVRTRPHIYPNRTQRLGDSLKRTFFGVPTPERSYEAAQGPLLEFQPDLVCISQAMFDDGRNWMHWCRDRSIPYVCIVHANAERWWPTDESAAMLRPVYEDALRVYFVSDHNRQLLRMQLGLDLPQAELVRNPVGVDRERSLPWPDESQWRLACVGRLEPMAKGQDLLLQILARPRWRERPLTIRFFGDGYCADGLKRLAGRLGVASRVEFPGFLPVSDIWAEHHALVLPSRHEGLPIALVEAMLCGRVSLVTDVAGNAELLEDGRTGFVAPYPEIEAVDALLERAWAHRQEWCEMGLAAAESARLQIPEDPAADFGERLLTLAGRTETAA